VGSGNGCSSLASWQLGLRIIGLGFFCVYVSVVREKKVLFF
jgi:hypothetical protein